MEGSFAGAGRKFLKIAPLAVVALALPACGVSQITSSLGSGVFGSQKPENSWAATITEENMLAAAKANPDGPMDVITPAQGCPGFAAPSGDRHVTIYEKGRPGDSLAVIHRGEITKTARECEVAAGQISVKYGFSGRVLLGPKGKPGIVTLPVQVHVTDKTRNKLKTEVIKVQVEVTADMPVGYFSVVRVITFPAPNGAPPQNYSVYVAFDRTIPGAG